MFEVVGALLFIGLHQPLLALVSVAITPLLSRLLRSVVVRSSAIIYCRQQVCWRGAGGAWKGEPDQRRWRCRKTRHHPGALLLPHPHPQVAAEALEFASERLAQVQTVQVFGQEAREAAQFGTLSETGYRMAERYALFQVRSTCVCVCVRCEGAGGVCSQWQAAGRGTAAQHDGHAGAPARPTHPCPAPPAGHCGGRGAPGGEPGHSGAAGLWWCAGHPGADLSGRPAGRWAAGLRGAGGAALGARLRERRCVASPAAVRH